MKDVYQNLVVGFIWVFGVIGAFATVLLWLKVVFLMLKWILNI